jgi:tetratricopeptide (TPR) repeat protein
MNFLPKLWDYIKKISLAVALLATIIAGGWVAYRYDISKKPQSVDKQLIVEGDNALNNGHYGDAKRIFQMELKSNPQNKQAAWGLKIAQTREVFFQPEFKDTIDALYQQEPNDAHVNLFMGEFYAMANQPDKAKRHYEQAIGQNPKLAEAHNDLAMLYDQQGNPEVAEVESLKAIDISPIPKYRNNLGAIYFKQQHYEEAIKEFGRNKEYPLSALESGKIYWRLEYLSQALSYQKQAIEWLEDPAIMAKPENQEPWFFEMPLGKGIELAKLAEKKSYAYYCLSVSLYLQGDSDGAEEAVQKLGALQVARLADIHALLAADLNALVAANSGFAESAAAYKQRYLQLSSI